MWRRACLFFEIALLVLVTVTTRCANYREVFVDGAIYFTDADCYSRMTRARMCFEQLGTVVRHHDFENYPTGTRPHTTAPFDYVIVALAEMLRPFSIRALDLAGAIVSPLIGLAGAAFLWGWMRLMGNKYRLVGVLLFAASPIVVHATELGRPDHQSLVLVLVVIGLCADWTRSARASRAWDVVSAVAWGLALWVSLFEPLVLLGIIAVTRVTEFRRASSTTRSRWWLVFIAILATAVIVERRMPLFSFTDNREVLEHWLGTIGELKSVLLLSPLWLEWCGYFVVFLPLLLAVSFRSRERIPLFVIVTAIATFGLTIWQARWGYFFVALLSIVLPALLSLLQFNRIAIYAAAFLANLPILSAWDAAIWPNESLAAARTERRIESHDLREAATHVSPRNDVSFLAPWWLSPELSYWSQCAAVAGSSHEAIAGTADGARFWISGNPNEAQNLLGLHRVGFVVAYDSDRSIQNSEALLGRRASPDPLAYILDRTPSSAPQFVRLVFANATCKVYCVNSFSKTMPFPEERR